MEHPKVYPYAADIARQNGELDQYRESNKLNVACAQAIDQAVRDNNYELFHYDLPAAAKGVLAEYGAERVQWVLASTIQGNDWDGRFSHNNKEWAKGFDIPERKIGGSVINTHPAILDGFVNNVRKAILENEGIAQPAPGQSHTPAEYKYYSLRRPIDIGTIPREPKPDRIDNFDSKILVENMAFSAWGAVTYKQPLTDKQVEDYELRAASTNPRERASVLDSLKENKQTALRTAPGKKSADKSGPEL